MSLRIFHIIFVVATVILSLYVAWWGIREFSHERNFGALALALLFLATAVGMTIYGKKAAAKFKELP
jgi:uncharacterized PurR-regulated membrane protein YhhQ (DUF165 family)